MIRALHAALFALAAVAFIAPALVGIALAAPLIVAILGLERLRPELRARRDAWGERNPPTREDRDDLPPRLHLVRARVPRWLRRHQLPRRTGSMKKPRVETIRRLILDEGSGPVTTVYRDDDRDGFGMRFDVDDEHVVTLSREEVRALAAFLRDELGGDDSPSDEFAVGANS